MAQKNAVKGANMGGYGSGKRGSGHPTTDSLLFLDIRYLRRSGLLHQAPDSPYSFTLSWSCRGKPSGNISVFVPHSGAPYPPEIILSYRTQARGDRDWKDVDERVAIETTPCHYGGERPWFLCPRCFDRRGVLFSVDGRFRCRACHGIAYSSTRETEEDRAIRRALVIQKRLGGHKYGTVFDPEPKPPHMHWATYERICNELDGLNTVMMAGFEARFGKLEKRFAALEDTPLGDLARLL